MCLYIPCGEGAMEKCGAPLKEPVYCHTYVWVGACGGHASVVRVLLEEVVCVLQVVLAVYGLGGVVQFVPSV